MTLTKESSSLLLGISIISGECGRESVRVVAAVVVIAAVLVGLWKQCGSCEFVEWRLVLAVAAVVVVVPVVPVVVRWLVATTGAVPDDDDDDDEKEDTTVGIAASSLWLLWLL